MPSNNHRPPVILGIVPAIVLAIVLTVPTSTAVLAQDGDWPKRVLITNDNGIEDVATLELARAFAKRADVVLVASSIDRSGTTNLMTFPRTGKFVVEPRDVGEGVRAWALDGYPADCVAFALAGPLVDAPPDLVISGINGGTNISDEWFGSGTIGAARTAAYFGIPAIAVSGVDDDNPDAVAAAVEWVVQLAGSGIMRGIQAPNYLTVSLPIGSPSEIVGVEVVERARGLMGGHAQLDTGDGQVVQGKEVWSISIELAGVPDADSDVAAISSGRIAVVPMRVGDADPDLLAWLRANADLLPEWQPSADDR